MENVQIIRNAGPGKKYAFVLPSGMTGQQFEAWKKRNKKAIDAKLKELFPEEETTEGDSNGAG